MASVGSEGGAGNQDFDLNIAPIIDCFTVLIAYLMVSASFLSLTVFDIEVAASGEATPSETPADDKPKDPPLQLTIQMLENNEVFFKVTGGAENLNVTKKIPALATNDVDVKSVEALVQSYKAKWPKLEDTNLAARPSVKYREIVKVIEVVKPVLPKIFLSGEKIILTAESHEEQIH